jgi:hypothetical protein
MISLEKFLEIFEGTSFPQKALVRFYHSIIESIALARAGRQGLPLLLRLVMEVQWPILEHLTDLGSSFYRGATNRELLSAFIATIERQKKNNTWPVVREMALERARLYEEIFELSPEEVASCEKRGRRLEEALIRKKRRQRLMMEIGGGAATVGALGTGAFLWLRRNRGKKDKG